MSWQYSSLADLKAAVQEARRAAESDARKLYRAYKNRGTCLVSCNDLGSASPYQSGEAIQWNYTLKSLRTAVARIESEYPQINRLALQGGFDGADNVNDLIAGCYEPWVSEWSLDVWIRDTEEGAGLTLNQKGESTSGQVP